MSVKPPKFTIESLREDDSRMDWLYLIRDKNERLRLFQRNGVQKDFDEHRTNRNIILKSRQHGVTTKGCIEQLDGAMFKPNFKALLVAHEKQEAIKIFEDKVEFVWNNMPDEVKALYRVDAKNTRELRFIFPAAADGTQPKSSVAVAESGRSGTYNHVHVSELGRLCARWPHKIKELVSGTFNTLPLDGRLDIESTAEGETGLFYDMFWDAWSRQGGKQWRKGMQKLPVEYSAFFYSWRWDEEEIAKAPLLSDDQLPSEFVLYKTKHNLTQQEVSYYHLKWLANNKDWKTLSQEYPTTPEEAFVSSGDKLFDRYRVGACTEDIEATREGDWVYLIEYNPRHAYALGADVAEGVGGDSSACVIWDFDTGCVAAYYHSNKIDPVSFAYEIKRGGNRYGTCLVAPERNNHGHATIAKLREIYPERAIYKEVRHGYAEDIQTGKLGWLSTSASRPRMFHDMVDAVREECIRVPSVIGKEMRMYPRHRLNMLRTPDTETRHFDLLTAACIGWQMRSAYQAPQVGETPEDEVAAMREAMQDIGEWEV